MVHRTRNVASGGKGVRGGISGDSPPHPPNSLPHWNKGVELEQARISVAMSCFGYLDSDLDLCWVVGKEGSSLWGSQNSSSFTQAYYI